MRKLTRNELKLIFGGATATANCGEGIVVSCSGTYSCTATDNRGCSCDDGSDEKKCPPIA